MQENDHKKFVFYVFEKCEAVDPCARLNAARSLLYLVQGKNTKKHQVCRILGELRAQGGMKKNPEYYSQRQKEEMINLIHVV